MSTLGKVQRDARTCKIRNLHVTHDNGSHVKGTEEDLQRVHYNDNGPRQVEKFPRLFEKEAHTPFFQ